MKNKFQIIIKGKTEKMSMYIEQFIDEATVAQIILPIFECVRRYNKAKNFLKKGLK